MSLLIRLRAIGMFLSSLFLDSPIKFKGKPNGDLMDRINDAHMAVGRIDNSEDYALMDGIVAGLEKECALEPDGYLLISDLKDHLDDKAVYKHIKLSKTQ